MDPTMSPISSYLGVNLADNQIISVKNDVVTAKNIKNIASSKIPKKINEQKELLTALANKLTDTPNEKLDSKIEKKANALLGIAISNIEWYGLDPNEAKAVLAKQLMQKVNNLDIYIQPHQPRPRSNSSKRLSGIFGRGGEVSKSSHLTPPAIEKAASASLVTRSVTLFNPKTDAGRARAMGPPPPPLVTSSTQKSFPKERYEPSEKRKSQLFTNMLTMPLAKGKDTRKVYEPLGKGKEPDISYTSKEDKKLFELESQYSFAGVSSTGLGIITKKILFGKKEAEKSANEAARNNLLTEADAQALKKKYPPLLGKIGEANALAWANEKGLTYTSLEQDIQRGLHQVQIDGRPLASTIEGYNDKEARAKDLLVSLMKELGWIHYQKGTENAEAKKVLEKFEEFKGNPNDVGFKEMLQFLKSDPQLRPLLRLLCMINQKPYTETGTNILAFMKGKDGETSLLVSKKGSSQNGFTFTGGEVVALCAGSFESKDASNMRPGITPLPPCEIEISYNLRASIDDLEHWTADPSTLTVTIQNEADRSEIIKRVVDPLKKRGFHVRVS